MSFARSSGILLHPTSLPGRFGIGDLGKAAYQFIDFLADSGQSLWQVLPLGPVGFGNSPYQCFSAFAGNTLLISPEMLFQDGLLKREDLENIPDFSSARARINFGAAIDFKNSILQRAYENFKHADNKELVEGYWRFCQQEAGWLDNYALFSALKDAYGGRAWNSWEKELVLRDEKALAFACEKFRDEIEAKKLYQHLFFKQWRALKAYCHQRRVKVIGDMPIFVAYDSADVWIDRESFKIDADGNPIVVAGVPPDFFSKTGQRWGNPIYNWEKMIADDFSWWIARMRAALDLFDIIRIDHFRGFAACWEVPASEATAERGQWVTAPGRELFTKLKSVFAEFPVIAEDLGVITPDVVALLAEMEFPGMRVLQFAFSGDSQNDHLPHHFVRNMTVYTGTHDNDTTIGWFNSIPKPRGGRRAPNERRFCLRYLNANGREINWDLIRAAWASVANLAIIPLQDLLGLGGDARMNLPASEDGNWGWRFQDDALKPELGERLRLLTELYGRLPKTAAIVPVEEKIEAAPSAQEPQASQN
jgi:4-alpha-glucanotransferase